MNNDRELLQQALYYMDDNCGAYTDDYRKLIEAIRARLAQCERCGEVNPAEIHTCTPKQHWSDCAVHSEPAYPAGECDCGGFQPEQEQEPVAWMGAHDETDLYYRKPVQADVVPLYTAPPQREWQGLTDEEILEEYRQSYGDDGDLTDVYFARAIETKLKEKNT